MRPINLIPVEERHGSRKPMRGGPVAYIVLGALLAALVGVILLVVANGQISDHTAEVATLKEETIVAEAEAARLAPYTQFHEVRSQRTTTVSNLADSRFDWERVMRQLSLVLPSDVWLTNLTGTVRPDVSVNNGESISLRESIAGPALSMVGCAAGQEAVARFVTDLKDIDGVTRVGVQSSELPGNSGGGESVSASGGCQTRNFIAQFQIVVAFDAAPIPAAATGSTEVTTPPPAETTPSGSEETATTPTEGG
jgi:Tfp pilus assembly protein PilN